MTAPRSIAIVAPRFPEGATVGGAETLLKSLAREALAAGIEVSFLTTCARDHFTWRNETPAGARICDGIAVQFFPVDDGRDISRFHHIQERISRGKSVSRAEETDWLAHNVNSTALYAHLREHGTRYDRILMGPYLFGLIHAAAAVHPERTVLVPCLHDEAFAYLSVFRDMFRQVRTVMFNSEPERDLAVRLFGPAMAGMPVVGMRIDPFEADPAAVARQHGLCTPYVMYAGRREPLKGTPLLLDYLDAFRQRTGRALDLVLTGSGPVTPPPSLAAHVHDLGFVSEQTKRDAMAGAVAFCHPSVNESFGIVIMESWMARTPVLVHDRCAVLRHHCRRANGGLWFRNYPEFESSLTLLMDTPAVRQALGEAGREYVLAAYNAASVSARFLGALAL